jgi:hypothetical protein
MAGVATPTEAAVMGVVGALVLAAVTGSLSWETFKDSLLGAVRTSCMIGLILVGAAFVTMAMAFTGLPATMANWVNALGLTPYGLILLLTLLYIVLGCFLDGVSMIVLTAPVVLPMVTAQQIDPLWFGIYIVLVVEMGADHAARRLQSLCSPEPDGARHLDRNEVHGPVLRPALRRRAAHHALPRHRDDPAATDDERVELLTNSMPRGRCTAG